MGLMKRFGRTGQRFRAFEHKAEPGNLAALALVMGCFVFAGQAAAQQVQGRLPSGAEPGRQLPTPVMPESTGPGQPITVPKARAVEAPAGAEKFSFTLKSVAIDGATVYSAEDLRPLYAPLLGKQVTVGDMFKVADDIELRYRSAGYVTTRVVVPQQTIDDGIFRIQVIEGFVSDIVYPDDIGPARAAVALLIDPLRNVRPISVGDIERQLLLANDLPGLTIKASLQASPTELGGSVIVVNAERKGFNVALTSDNRNTPYTGAFEWLMGASWNSFGSHADQLSLNAKVSSPLSREWSVQADYQGLFSSGGLTLGFSSFFSRANPGAELDPLNVHSRVASEIGTATYPIIRSRLENLRVIGELEYRDIVTNLGRDAFNRDKLRIARIGLSYDRTDNWDGITAVRATIHQGLPIMDATPQGSQFASRVDGHSDFTKLTLGVTRIQQLPDNFSLLASTTAQFSTVPLLASEQLALGGPNFGRAYDEGEVSGDDGLAGLIELRYSPDLPKIMPHGLQFYAYFDAGQVWNAVSPPTGGETLTSIGGGIRANPLENLSATLEFDRPLDREVMTQQNKSMRVFFSVTARY
jgi:hemolysin activation/secretion protein